MKLAWLPTYETTPVCESNTLTPLAHWEVDWCPGVDFPLKVWPIHIANHTIGRTTFSNELRASYNIMMVHAHYVPYKRSSFIQITEINTQNKEKNKHRRVL